MLTPNTLNIICKKLKNGIRSQCCVIKITRAVRHQLKYIGCIDVEKTVITVLYTILALSVKKLFAAQTRNKSMCNFLINLLSPNLFKSFVIG